MSRRSPNAGRAAYAAAAARQPTAPTNGGPSVSVIRVNYLTDFYYGDPAVLVALDGAGVGEMLDAVRTALTRGSAALDHDGVLQEFHIQPGAADIAMNPTHLVWRLDECPGAPGGRRRRRCRPSTPGSEWAQNCSRGGWRRRRRTWRAPR